LPCALRHKGDVKEGSSLLRPKHFNYLACPKKVPPVK
jgi:hypothetical protein